MKNRCKTLLRDHSVPEVILQAYPKHIQFQLYRRPSPLEDLKEPPKKKEHITWERTAEIANKNYMKRQQNQIQWCNEKMKKKQLELEEAKKKAKAEADRIAKEEADRIAHEKELQHQHEEAERNRQAALLLQKQEEERQRMKLLEEEAENSAKSEIENILNTILLSSF